MARARLPKIWIFSFVLFVILFVVAFFQSTQLPSNDVSLKKGDPETLLPSSPEQNAVEMLQNGNNSIYVTDQLSGSAQITIGYAIFEKPGFIVVRDDQNGLPGNVIGVSGRLSGRVEHPSMDLNESLKADRVYYAELVADDGDGVFEESKDLSVNDKTKSVVLMSFLAKPAVMRVSTAP